jgi:hypothetical protein
LRPVHRIAFACPSGTVISAGDTQLNAALARSTYGIDGSGVQIGVLSDSYNKDTTAVTHAVDDIASGDLPGIGNPCGFTSAVNVLPGQEDPSGYDEGRAIMQIVHDIAPGATLSFATADNGLYSFADNIRNLRSAGADIIVDDVAYYDEPFFQEGPVNVAISDVVSAGALYFTAAGNDNLIINGHNISSYEAPAYRPTSCPAGVTTWASSPARGWTYMDCHNFEPSSGSNAMSRITIDSGCSVTVNFQWNEPWNGVTTDMDFFVLNAAGAVVAASYYYNVDSEPFEIIPNDYSGEGQIYNASGLPANFYLVIARYSGSAPPRLKYVFMQNGLSCITSVQYNTSNGGDIVGPSIYGHSSTRDGFSVAAVPYYDSNTPEFYTSRGPATHYFGPVVDDTPASAITPYVLQQPDFAATDGGCTTFFYPPLDSGCYRFYGTSAAAPHAAAVTALLKQKANQLSMSLSPTVTKHVLQTSAQTVSGGDINSTGGGLLDANAGVARLLSLEPVIRIQGSTIVGGYTTVQAAYNNTAVSGDVIEMISTTFNESLLFNAGKDFTLRGGFSSEFPSQSGITTVHGTLTINNGKVTIDRLVLR